MEHKEIIRLPLVVTMLIVFMYTVCFFAVTSFAGSKPQAKSITKKGRVYKIGGDKSSVWLSFGKKSPEKFGVANPSILQPVESGDLVNATIKYEASKPPIIDNLTIVTRYISVRYRLIIFIIVALVILGIATLFARWNPLSFIIGIDNRYSNSQFQIALWFLTLFTIYISAIIIRVKAGGWDFLGCVGIPQNLLVLSGLSALTYGGARAVTTQKVKHAKSSGSPNAAIKDSDSKDEKGNKHNPSLYDFVQNDNGDVDIGDFQMLFVTILAVVIYVVTAFHFLGAVSLVSYNITLPDVDTTLLAGFGVGQGAYLVKKMASNVGEG